MKIIVVGTPKTGNTWVKHLLADVYNLPIVGLGSEFSCVEVEAAGPRWISHQHYLPKHALLSWARANRVIFVSVTRHPADVLISLWHHVRQHRTHRKADFLESTHNAALLAESAEINSETTVRFVQEHFPAHLNLSIAWSAIEGVVSLRYEDLWSAPLETLSKLTGAIEPRPEERLKISLCACELGLMQSLLDPEKTLIRKGGTGAWVSILSPEIKTLLATLDPYPAQFARLGYTMDEGDPANTPQGTPGRIDGPFSVSRHFDDGTLLTPVLMKAYYDLPSTLRARWLVPQATTPESFYAWLNHPAAADPTGGARNPVITELAHYIHSQRSDLQKAFPDPFGTNRSEFCEWFLFDARKEYGLANSFLRQNPFVNVSHFSDGTPIARVLVRAYLDQAPDRQQAWGDPVIAGKGSYLAWLKSPAIADPATNRSRTVVTELGAYLHSIRPDLHELWPDLYGAHRVDFSDWFISRAVDEYQLDRSLTEPVTTSWTKCLHTDADSFSDGTQIAPILARAYLSLPEAIRERWPDPSRAGDGSYLAWLKSPAAADPAGGDTAPIVTELGAYLYSIRSDVRTLMPDLFGDHRVDFADWFVSSAVSEYRLDRSLVLPVTLSWAKAATALPPLNSSPLDRSKITAC